MLETKRDLYQEGFSDGVEAGKRMMAEEISKKVELLRDPRNKYTEHRRWNAALDAVQLKIKNFLDV